MKKLAGLILSTAMVVSMVSGCGVGGSSGSASKSQALSDGVLTVGTNAEFPPFEYVGDDGEPDGFDIALIKAVGEELGVKVVVENMDFDSLVSAIGSKIDVAIAGMTVTEERKQSVDFSESYFDAVQHVLVPAGSDISSKDDLVGKKIGVQLGTTGDFLVEDIEGATAQQYNKAVDAVNDLVNGRVDAVIVDSNPAGVFAKNFEGAIKDLDGADFGFEVENYAIAIPKGDSELKTAIDNALKKLKENGTYDELVKKYI